ncbi:pyrroline-5-carboxylate reductase, partial [Gammaproteobacteria bacterium SCGC AG-212-F23]
MHIANITILGAGNMGASLLGGLIADQFPADKIWIADPAEEKLAVLQKNFLVHTAKDNKNAVKDTEIIILAVKPQMMATVVQEIAPIVQSKKPLVISIAAGVRVQTIQTWLGGNIPIVRVMPNTPALLGCGASGLFANAFVNETQHDQAESILRAVGITVWLQDENLMDAVTAVSGSGPAYFFLVMESLQHAAEALGLSKDVARLLTLQTALGAARMALESNHSIAELRKQVTSPGGTTEQALRILEEKNVREIFMQAVNAAAKRSKELA